MKRRYVVLMIIVVSLFFSAPGYAFNPQTLPEITLNPGDTYFSVDGQQQFVFLRNVTSYQQKDFDTILDWTQKGGSRIARIQLIEGLRQRMGSNGAVDERWAQEWERVFDQANAEGIYVIPVFSSWFGWDGHLWPQNPLNRVNGGPAAHSSELLIGDSETQQMWLAWMTALVERWQDRPNILAWEIFSELNLVSGATDTLMTAFIERAAEMINEADQHQRPITASLANFGEWPMFYRSEALDFIQMHPYPPSGELDMDIIDGVRSLLIAYDKPVLIGESGLSAEIPDGSNLTTAENAMGGVQHAIWAGVVSGAMNGRALYWEDSYGVYFPELSFPFMEPYAESEGAAAHFVAGVDFAGFEPLFLNISAGIKGGAIGHERLVIGWFRDAACEPPDWAVQTVAQQWVTIRVPGDAAEWRVDFYDTETGERILDSVTAARDGNLVRVELPEFTDSIAFKMVAED